MIKVENLSKKYGTIYACSGVSFEVIPGEVTALVGPNGAGKSTVLKCISGVLIPDSGTITIRNFDLQENSLAARSIMGSVFENAPLYSGVTVLKHLLFTAQMFGMKKKEALDRVHTIIELCKLDDVAHRLTDRLSRGFRQRTGLALALVHDPEILILDEPTSGLDPVQLEEFRSIIRALSPSKTILISTHIMQEVESLCSKIIVLNHGACVTSGSIDEICKATDTDSIEQAFVLLVSKQGADSL